MIECKDSLEWLKTQEDFSADIIFADPPYALGSTVIIKENGKPDYKKAVDFMSKWEMPNGEYWEQWFKEAFRVLKHGGRCLLFSIDRQSFLFRYYACMSGLEATQNLYWYFISNFPKSADLSINIAKREGAKREGAGSQGNTFPIKKEYKEYSNKSELSKKYEGIKYSISPLKQTLEEIIVFNKPTKTGSVLHDVIAYENGDNTISVNAWNIDNGRVATDDKYDIRHYQKEDCFQNTKPKESQFLVKPQPDGRYPSQLFVDTAAAEILDEQSGVKKGSDNVRHNNQSKNTGIENGAVCYGKYNDKDTYGYSDIGGASKILHHCDFVVNEFNLLNYCPKTSSFERNAGCDEMENKKYTTNITPKEGSILKYGYEEAKKIMKENCFNKNSHPTLKPIKLIYQIAKLLKMPVNQKVLFPFAGSGSEIIGFMKAGFNDIHGCEINQEYIDIANSRIKYWQSVNFDLECRPKAKTEEQKGTMESLF